MLCSHVTVASPCSLPKNTEVFILRSVLNVFCFLPLSISLSQLLSILPFFISFNPPFLAYFFIIFLVNNGLRSINLTSRSFKIFRFFLHTEFIITFAPRAARIMQSDTTIVLFLFPSFRRNTRRSCFRMLRKLHCTAVKACLHQFDFLLLSDVNERTDNECSEYLISHLKRNSGACIFYSAAEVFPDCNFTWSHVLGTLLLFVPTYI